MRYVEGYLPADTPLWMWQDETAEQMVAAQEYWIDRNYLAVRKNSKPHYGVIFDEWPELAKLITDVGRNRYKPDYVWMDRNYR